MTPQEVLAVMADERVREYINRMARRFACGDFDAARDAAWQRIGKMDAGMEHETYAVAGGMAVRAWYDRVYRKRRREDGHPCAHGTSGWARKQKRRAN